MSNRALSVLIVGLLSALVVSTRTAAQDPPTADALVEKAIAAMGGTAIAKIESYCATSEMTAPMGTMASVVSWSSPQHVLVKRSIPQMGEIEMGSDGTVGWMMNPMMGGYQLMEADQLDDILDQALHIRILNLREMIKKISTRTEGVGEADFDGARCRELRLAGEAGQDDNTVVLFDMESGLIRGMKVSQMTPQGAEVTVITLRDWRPIEKVMFFHGLELASGQIQMSVKYSSIDVNKVDPATMAVPAEVTALAAKQTDEPMNLQDFTPQVQKMIRSTLDSLNMDDAASLQMARDSIGPQAERMPGEYRKGMEYILKLIDARLEELGRKN